MPNVVPFPADRTKALDMRDPLTGLASVGAAHDALMHWQDTAADRDKVAPVHAMLIALGRFDAVNLAYGLAAGDGALVTVSQRILHFAQDEFAHSEWLAARLGGGKFLLAAHEACSRERWQWLAEALADAIAHPIGHPIAEPGGTATVRLWPRIALMRPLPGETSPIIFDRLAETLERVSGQHSRRVLWADGELTVPGRRSASVDADLLTAIDRGEIEIVFQPQVDVRSGRIVGAEALARWQHPELGRIGASQLFTIAERTDHVAQLSRHVAQTALMLAAKWPTDMFLSINVTPADLATPNFAHDFSALVTDNGFDPARLTLEITEHVLLADLDLCAAMLTRLRDGGIRIALDDFGAGFCNFRYLKMLPLDAIKLDRDMVDGVTQGGKDLAVLRGIVAMAKALHLSVIVEGIETREQLAIIAQEKVDLYQGFLCAEPLESAALLKLLRS